MVFWKDGRLRWHGRVDMTRSGLEGFGHSLARGDGVVVVEARRQRGMPLAVKVTAVPLYVSGLSMNRTAKLLGVSTPGVQAWIERFAGAHARKPEPEGGQALVIERDQMWRYLKRSPTSSGCGRLGIVLRGGSRAGSAAIAIELPSSGC